MACFLIYQPGNSFPLRGRFRCDNTNQILGGWLGGWCWLVGSLVGSLVGLLKLPKALWDFRREEVRGEKEDRLKLLPILLHQWRKAARRILLTSRRSSLRYMD